MKNKKFKVVMRIQLAVILLALGFIIATFFVKSLADYREIALGLVLLMMGYTNLAIYEKKKMAIIYFVFGGLLIAANVIKLVI